MDIRYLLKDNTDDVVLVHSDGSSSFTKLSSDGAIPEHIRKLVAEGTVIAPYLEPEKTVDQLHREEYIAKGWGTPYDLIDDILDRGVALVKVDRDEILDRIPRGVPR